MRRLRGGFTLIELLVVVAIIALLISILLPALSEAKKRAQETVCGSNMRQMGLALRHYLDDNNGFYPGDHLETGGRNGSWIAWAPRIRKYLDGQMNVYWCPSTDIGIRWERRQGGAQRSFLRLLGYEPGETPLKGEEFFSYGYNGWGVRVFTNFRQRHLGLGGHIGGGIDDRQGNHELQESKIKRPEEMIAIGDTFMNAFWDTWLTPDVRSPESYPSKRHRGGAEILFTDGHAVNMHLDELLGKRNVEGTTLNRSAASLRRWNNDFQPHHNYWRHYP